MTEIKRSINIEAPVNKVFEYASDFLKWSEFFEGVSDFKPITEITHGNGTKLIYKAKMLGIKVTVGTELQQFKVNEGWIGKSFKGTEHKTQWIFKMSNGNTEVTYILNYKFPMGRFLDKKFMQPAWIKIIENSLQNLKNIMEKKR
ncbi:MAG: SRPBCC family protein [bacterium]